MRGAFFRLSVRWVADMPLVLGALAWYMLDRYKGTALLPVAMLGVSLPGFAASEPGPSRWVLGQGRADGAGGAHRSVSAALAFGFVMSLLWFMLALTTLTPVPRFVMVWRQANRTGYGPDRPAERRCVRSTEPKR